MLDALYRRILKPFFFSLDPETAHRLTLQMLALAPPVALPPDPPELATKLARETVAGSGELLHRSEIDPATLRQNVTSPGGTTAAALEVLMAPDGMQSLLMRAVVAATRRSKELAK